MQNKLYQYIIIHVIVILLCACENKKQESLVAPWGKIYTESAKNTDVFSVDDMINNGEMIILTVSGPETYFDYHGKDMGTQYLLCEKFAQSIGVSLRVEVCKDTLDMVNRLLKGEADLIVLSPDKNIIKDKRLRYCVDSQNEKGIGWWVANKNTSLSNAIKKWYQPGLFADVKKEETYLLSANNIKRHIYAPFIDRKNGIISKYDNLFRRYASAARVDWKLLAAQCYQESCFDTNACSWAGARGLMQIMPSTADHLGLAYSDLNNPELNIQAATKYYAELTEKFRYVPSAIDRHSFVLASYNGGANHIKDAMALTKKNGGNPHSWAHVAPYILKLQQPQYYNDPVVKYGYMRGSETVEYVEKIKQRYALYRGIKYNARNFKSESTNSSDFPTNIAVPKRATKKYKYHI